MAKRVQIKRGLAANRPNSGMLAGEQFFTTDRHTLDVATDPTTRAGVLPEIDALTAIGAVTGASDLLIIHDADATGVKEKKITVDAFKTALNIPAGSSDEKAAVISGGTSGYLWGTNGSDGILRMGASMAMTKSAGNDYVTLEVDVVDCGTF
ncbi:hypothetical protein [Thiocystis violascens]|uniref:Major tropism determinant N-terminal domain-containing protein n=1 Tax=Thiocystis violascens (strain ATCC 17096 / DSM 198 / 6111) TaxID=765911 RepID=I3YEI3_THIV6|nr:hypothetical protein [Thiocystis violascens]AFL75401.1 hypothetical protein Thivi_3534 [Thiocystis violascens DSM 198]